MSTVATSTPPAPSRAMSSTPLSTSNLPTSTRPADRTAWTPAAARLRASVRAAWYWENRKAPNRWYWGAVTALCTLSSLSGYLQYRTYQNELQPQGITWDALWPHSTLPLSMWLLPLVLSVFAAQIAAGERQGDGWRRMRASHLETIMIVGKLLHGLQVAVGYHRPPRRLQPAGPGRLPASIRHHRAGDVGHPDLHHLAGSPHEVLHHHDHHCGSGDDRGNGDASGGPPTERPHSHDRTAPSDRAPGSWSHDLAGISRHRWARLPDVGGCPRPCSAPDGQTAVR